MSSYLYALCIILSMLFSISCRPMYNNQPVGGRNDRSLRNDPIYTDKVAYQLYQVIDEFMGVPYKKGGSSAMGMDCSGFVHVVFDKSINLDLGRTTSEQFKLGQEVKKRDLKYGDLVFFDFTGEKKKVTHVGIYVGNSQFVHASTTRGVVTDRLDQTEYLQSYVGAKRVYP